MHQAQQKHKPHTVAMSKTMAPHLEQVPSLLERVTDKKSLNHDNVMVISDPANDIAGPSTSLNISYNNMDALLYDNELDLSF